MGPSSRISYQKWWGLIASAFRIQNRDRREEFIRSYDHGLPFMCQIPSGPEVEFFQPNIGFGLIAKQKILRYTNKKSRRVRSVAELSLGPSLALREFYYVLRSNPKLVEPFKDNADIYAAVLKAINDMEIVADVDRRAFTMGNPMGALFYGHDEYGRYNNPETLVGLSEQLVLSTINNWNTENSLNVIHLEKMSALSRLVGLDFSKLTNSIITSTGGNFTRAVYALAKRYVPDKELIFFTDGDAYGQDMLRTLEYGSMASRHLTADQAFPSSKYANVHMAGLFPSVGERLGLPNDVEQKRPMSNPQTKKRVEFMKRYDLVDQRDIDTWENNQTFELEALSAQYRSTVTDDPIGLAIYLTEFMRIKNIPCKPQPTDNDGALIEEFTDAAHEGFKALLKDRISRDSPIENMKATIETQITKIIESITDAIYEDYLDALNEKIDEVSADMLRDKAKEQYQDTPTRAKFSMSEMVAELFDQVEVSVKWDAEDLAKKTTNAVKTYADAFDEEDVTEEIELNDMEEVGELRDFYDVIEDYLGADPSDCERVRDALAWRLT